MAIINEITRKLLCHKVSKVPGWEKNKPLAYPQNALPFFQFKRSFYFSILKSAQRIGPHKKEVLDALIGNLLGDGYAEKRGNATRIILKQSAQKINYIHHLHKIMCSAGVCSEKFPKIKSSLGKSGKVYYSAKFATYSFSSFNPIYQAFYGEISSSVEKSKSNRKMVPDNIETLLSERGLAHWIMDDGILSRQKGSVGGLRISTESFSFGECKKLEKALKDKFSIFSTVQKQKMESGLYKRILYIPKREMEKVAKLVTPYFEKSLLYKIRDEKSRVIPTF